MTSIVSCNNRARTRLVRVRRWACGCVCCWVANGNAALDVKVELQRKRKVVHAGLSDSAVVNVLDTVSDVLFVDKNSPFYCRLVIVFFVFFMCRVVTCDKTTLCPFC